MNDSDTASAFFSRELLIWYRQNKRDLPWRKSKNPYYIWVSEIMLQQTRVDTVIPYFERFTARFPTVTALAEAPEEEVLKCWEGLGYYSRARNLQAGAREIVDKHNGEVPDDIEAVAALKGVGPYTSGAIMSIAFNRPQPAVDGNVMRVLSRYFVREEDIAKASTRPGIERLAASLIPEGEAGDFNQALMELGALVCTPGTPSCLPCPVQARCGALREGRTTDLPLKTKAKPPKHEYRGCALIAGSGELSGKVLVRQRPAKGLLAGMWELPHLLLDKEQAGWLAAGEPEALPELADLLSQTVQSDAGVLMRPIGWLLDADHVFSHIHWHLRVYVGDLGMTVSATTPISTDATATEGGVARSVAEASEDGFNEKQQRSKQPSSALLKGLRLADSDSLYAADLLASQSPEWLALAMHQDTPSSPQNSEIEAAALKVASPYRWISEADMEQLAFPNVFLKILRHYFAQQK